MYVKYHSTSGDESPTAFASINYVKELTEKVSANATTETKTETKYVYQVIKKYNNIILNEQRGQAPALPQVLSPISNSYVLGDQLTITGSALPNTIVTLHIHSPEELVVKVVTDEKGNFVYNINEKRLSPSGHQIYASIDNDKGNLVGPAVAFSVVKDNTRITSSETVVAAQPARLGLFVWLLLLGWLLVIAVLILMFYRAYLGYGFSLKGTVLAVYAKLIDKKFWRGMINIYVHVYYFCKRWLRRMK